MESCRAVAAGFQCTFQRDWLRLNGIDDFEKRKAVEVGVTRADLTDSVLAHEDSRVCVVEDVA